MLYYSSIHPEWSGTENTSEMQALSEQLSTVVSNHPRHTGSCFDHLERAGVILGNGGFEAALLQSDPDETLPADPRWQTCVTERSRDLLGLSLWYCFSADGRLYILVCCPRLREDSPESLSVREEISESFQRLRDALLPEYPRLRILLSDLQYGDSGIFRCFNNLYHAREYFDFRSETPNFIQLDSEQQLHQAFIADMSAYRQFSVAMSEQLVRDSIRVSDLSDRLVDTIIERSVPSMESVHHHIQMLMLTFTDYLGSSGLVDASYLRRHNIVYRSLAFETEAELRALMTGLLEELRRQHRVLLAVGRRNRVLSIREYVETHIAEPDLTVTQISQIFGISAAQIAKQFRYYFGVSLHRYLQQTRFALARQLIGDHPEWSMRQVAEAAGYTDISTMYRAFRQFGGITPGALKSSAGQKS